MDDVKSFLQSRTVWSGILVLASIVLQKYGYTFTDADQTGIVDAVSKVGETLGALGTIYFRVKATKAIA